MGSTVRKEIRTLEKLQVNLQQATFISEHFFDGIHKFEDPVSNTTRKDCGGVPNEIGP